MIDGTTVRAKPTKSSDAAHLRGALRRLLVYREVLADEIGRAWLEVVDALATGAGAGEPYARLFALVADEVASPGWTLLAGADPLRAHLLRRILADDNPFSRACRRLGRAPTGALREAARADLATMRAVLALSGDALAEAVAAAEDNAFGRPVSLGSLGADVAGSVDTPDADSRARLLADPAAFDDWPSLAERLAAHYAAHGVGLFGQYRALRWKNGDLHGIAEPDPITLAELVGYDAEREPLLRNTAHLLAGRRANNVLLYGDRGTGKSSTVKALLNEPANRDLRLIEVAKDDLGEFPSLVARLRHEPECFVVFVDDLSFDDGETQYKSLKAVLEGGLETRPENVVLYATSNRRHLVQERFGDRAEPGAEVHGLDGLQEKLSLADRFGVTVTFLAPDQERFLGIVESLARRAGVSLAADDLRRRALRWAIWQNGRSGRVARQFVDDLLGEVDSPRRG